MFDIGWSELLIVGIVALIVIGPRELPGVLRMVGQWIGKVRRMAADFQNQFNEAMREAEMDDLKKQVDELAESANDLGSGFDPIGSMQETLDESFDDEPKPSGSKASTTEPESVASASTEASEPASEPAASSSEPDHASGVVEAESDTRAEDDAAPPPKAAAGGHPA